MNIKKTWFSYILWLLATGFSVCFFGYNASNLVTLMGLHGVATIGMKILYSVFLLLVAMAFCIFLCVLRQKINFPNLSKGFGNGIHVLFLVALAVVFFLTRINAAFDVIYDSQQVINLYETSKIGANIEMSYVPLNIFDKMYSGLLTGVFLFLGNKVEVMFYIQILLQTCNFLLLIYIGSRLLNGFTIWIPAAGYVFSPVFADAVADMDATNFCFFLVVCLIAIICSLMRFFEQTDAADIIVNVTGIVAGIFIFFINIRSFSLDSYTMAGGDLPAFAVLVNAVLLGGLLLLYCVVFWFSQKDFASVYIIAPYLYAGLLFLTQQDATKVKSLLLMIMYLYLYVVAAHGISIFFTTKGKVNTEKTVQMQWEEMSRSEISKRDAAIMNEISFNRTKSTPMPQDESNSQQKMEMSEIVEEESKLLDKEMEIKQSSFEWWEKDKNMEEKHTMADEVNASKLPVFTPQSENDYEEEEAVLIRVSDIVKDDSFDKGGEFLLSNQSDEVKDVTVIDKTSMIENVLPMPKKHVNRTLDYAFEPSEEQMCYDIDVSADDDYDYLED